MTHNSIGRGFTYYEDVCGFETPDFLFLFIFYEPFFHCNKYVNILSFLRRVSVFYRYYLYIVRLYSCHAPIARYVRDFANILRFSRFLRFATSLTLLKLRNFYITLLLISFNNKCPTVENGPYSNTLKLVSLHCSLLWVVTVSR